MSFKERKTPETSSSTRDKSLSITGGYYANVGKYLHRQKMTELNYYRAYRDIMNRKDTSKSAKDFFVEADVTDEDTVDIENQEIQFKRMRLNFKIKRNISALVSGVPSSPDGPVARFDKVTFQTKESIKNTEESLEQIKKADEEYFKVYKQQQQDKKEFAKFEAKITNILLAAGGTLILAGTLYFVGPYALSYFLSSMGGSTSTLASATTTFHEAAAAKKAAETVIGQLQPFLDKVKAPTAEDIAKLLAEDPSLQTTSNAASVLQARYRKSLFDLIFDAKQKEPGFITGKAANEASELVSQGLNAQASLASLTQAESSALAAMKLAEKTLGDSSYWKKLGFKFVSEVFFGLTPYQVNECEQLVSNIQKSMLQLVKSDIEFSRQPERIFEIAFNGKNPLLGNVENSDLAHVFTNEKGIQVQNVFLRNFQSSVLSLTNFMIDRAVGPAAGHFLKFDVTSLTNKASDSFFKDVQDTFSGLTKDPDWQPNFAEQAGLSWLAKATGQDSQTLEGLVGAYKTTQQKVKALQAISNFYSKYKLEFDKVKALFYPPESVEPEIREPLMGKMWGRVKNSTVLRGAFSEFWLESFGYDRKSLEAAAAAAAAASDNDDKDKEKEKPPSLDEGPKPKPKPEGAAEEEEAAPELQDTFVSSPSRSAKLAPRKASEAESEKEEEKEEKEEEEEEEKEEEEKEEEPKQGILRGTFLVFKDLAGRSFQPASLIGYASNCVYDTATNMITSEIERAFPGQFKKEEMPLTEEQQDKKKQEQELYEQGLQEMRIMYLKQGINGDELVHLMREQAMLTRPGATLDAENMNVLEYTFKKIQRQAGELSKRGLAPNIFYYWGLASSISLVNEITTFSTKPTQKGDNGFGENADATQLDYYGVTCKPMVESLITYMQTQTTSVLAEAALALQQSYRKIYEDVYEQYIRKPMTNSKIIKYINNNIRKKMTHVTSRVFNRIFLGVYISKIFNKVIDLVFDTIIQIGTNLPTKNITEFQNYMYEKFGDLTIAGIQPFQFQKYTIPTGWDSVVKSLNGKKLIDMWRRFDADLSKSGWLSNKRKFQYLLADTDEDLTDQNYQIYLEKGFSNLDEAIGVLRQKFNTEEDVLKKYERGIFELMRENDHEGLFELRSKFKDELANQIRTAKTKLQDPNLSPEEKEYLTSRMQTLVVFYVTNKRQIDIGLERTSDWSRSWLQDELAFDNLPTSVKDELGELGLTEQEQKDAYQRFKVGFDFTMEFAKKIGGSILDHAMNSLDRVVVDALYDLTNFYTGERRRDALSTLKISPDLDIPLEGNAMKRFNNDERRGKFISYVTEKNLLENLDTTLTDEQFREFVKRKIQQTGYKVLDTELDALVMDCKTQYERVKNLIGTGDARLTYEAIAAICRDERKRIAQELVDKYIKELLPDMLRGAGHGEPKSIAEFQYVMIGKSQYAKVETLSEEEAMKSSNPVERYLRIKLTPISSDTLSPEQFKRVNETPALQFKSVNAFENGITKYLLGKYVDVTDTKNLFTLKTKESFNLFGNFFTTVAEKPTDKAAKKYMGEGLAMLMGSSPDNAAIDTNSPLYKALAEELTHNDVFAANLLSYMGIPDQEKVIDNQIELIINGPKSNWTDERRRAHKERMKDYAAGKTGRIDSDLIDLIQAKEDLERQKADAYHAMMSSLSTRLQEALQYNRKAALQEYIQRLTALRKKILTEDAALLNSMNNCDDSPGTQGKLADFEKTYNFVKNGPKPPQGLATSAPDLYFTMPNLDGIDKHISTAKLGCIPTKQLSQMKRQLKDIRTYSKTLIGSLKSLAEMKQGSLDIRHIFEKVNELEQNRNALATNFPYFKSMNANYAAAMTALNSRSKELQATRNKMMRLQIRALNSRVRKDAHSTWVKAEEDYSRLKEQQRGSSQYVQDFLDLEMEAQIAFDEDTGIKDEETADQYFERLTRLLLEAKKRGDKLDTLTRNAMMEYTSRVSGSKGFQYVVNWFSIPDNNDKMDLTEIPTYDVDLETSPLFETASQSLKPLLDENRELTGKINNYNLLVQQIRTLLKPYKGVKFGDPLLEEQKKSYAEYRRLMALIERDYPTLQEDIDAFNLRAKKIISEAEKSHRDAVKKSLTKIKNELPDAPQLEKEITRVQTLLTIAQMKNTDPKNEVTQSSQVVIQLTERLQTLQFLKLKSDQLRGSINSKLVDNELGIVKFRELESSYTDQIYVNLQLEGAGPDEQGKGHMSIKQYSDLYRSTNADWIKIYEGHEKDFLALMKGNYIALQAKINGHVAGAKTALSEKWKPIYTYYLKKYGTPQPNGKDPTEPLLPTAPPYVTTLMQKARAFMDIGLPNERYPKYATVYSVTFPMFYDDTSKFQENIDAIKAMEGLVTDASNLVDKHTQEYKSGAEFLRLDEEADEKARLKAIANAASREAASKNIANVDVFKQNTTYTEWLTTGAKILDLPSNLQEPHKTTYTTQSEEAAAIELESSLLKQEKDITGKQLTPQEVQTKAAELKKRKDKLLQNMASLTTAVNKVYSDELKRLKELLPELRRKYNDLSIDLDSLKRLLGTNVKPSVNTCSETFKGIKTRYDKSLLANFETLYNTPKKLEEYIRTLSTDITGLHKTVTSEYTTAQQELLTSSITSVKSARDTALKRYNETLTSAKAQLTELEKKLAKIQSALLRAPGDSRVRVEYKKAKNLVDTLKDFIEDLETDEDILDVVNKLQGVFDPETKTYKNALADPTTQIEVDGMENLVASLNEHLNGFELPNFEAEMEECLKTAARLKEQTTVKLKKMIEEDKKTIKDIETIRMKEKEYPVCMASLDFSEQTKDFLGYKTRCDEFVLTDVEERTKALLDEDPTIDFVKILKRRLQEKEALLRALEGTDSKPALSDEELKKYLEDNPEQAEILMEASTKAMQAESISGKEKDDILSWLSQKLQALQKQKAELETALRDKTLEKSKQDEITKTLEAAKQLEKVLNDLKTKLSTGETMSEEESTTTRVAYEESLGEEEQDRDTEEEGPEMKQDEQFSWYMADREFVQERFERFHQETDEKKKLYTKYDFFSFCDGKYMVTAGEFQEFFIREMAIDEFMEDHPNLTEAEQKDLRERARKCFNLEKHTFDVEKKDTAGNVYYKSPEEKEFFQLMKETYEGTWSDPPSNNYLLSAIFTTASLFEIKYGDPNGKNKTLNTLGVSRITNLSGGPIGASQYVESLPSLSNVAGRGWNATVSGAESVIEGVKGITLEGIKETAAAVPGAVVEGAKAAASATVEGVKAIPTKVAEGVSATVEGVAAIPTKVAEGVAGVKDELIPKDAAHLARLEAAATGKIKSSFAQDLDSRMRAFLDNKAPPDKTAYEWAYAEWLAKTKKDAHAESMSSNWNTLSTTLASGLTLLYAKSRAAGQGIVDYSKGIAATAMKTVRSYFTNSWKLNDPMVLRNGKRFFKGLNFTPSKFAQHLAFVKKYVTGKRSTWVGVKNLSKQGWRYVRRSAKGGWKYLKATGKGALTSIKEAGKQVLTKDFWKGVGQASLREGRKLLSLDTYKNFIQANPGVVLTLTTTIGLYIGSKYNDPKNHFKPFGVNVGFGTYGALGMAAGFAVGAGVLLLAGVSAPAIAIAAAGALAWSAGNYLFWSAVEKVTGVQAKLPGESDEAMFDRVKAIVDNVPNEFLKTATAGELTLFVQGKGKQGRKKTDERFKDVETGIAIAVSRLLDQGELAQYADRLPLINGKRDMQNWEKKFTDAELQIIFTSVVRYRKPKDSPTPSAATGGARTVIEITPVDDLFDMVFLFIYMNHMKYLNKGYPKEYVHNLVLLEYFSVIMPICQDLRTIDFDTVDPMTIMLVAIELPYDFLVFSENKFDSLSDLLDMMHGNKQIRRLTIQELLQRAENPQESFFKMIAEANQAESTTPALQEEEIQEPTIQETATQEPKVSNLEQPSDLPPNLPKPNNTIEEEEDEVIETADALLAGLETLYSREITSTKTYIKYSIEKKILESIKKEFNDIESKDSYERDSQTVKWIDSAYSTALSLTQLHSKKAITQIQRESNQESSKLMMHLMKFKNPKQRAPYDTKSHELDETNRQLRKLYNEINHILKQPIDVSSEARDCQNKFKGYDVYFTRVGRDDANMIKCLQQIITQKTQDITKGVSPDVAPLFQQLFAQQGGNRRKTRSNRHHSKNKTLKHYEEFVEI